MSEIKISHATSNNVEAIHAMILELAKFEKMEDEAQPDLEALRQYIHHSRGFPGLCCLLAEVDNKGFVGFALYHGTFSTFGTRWNMHLEDIYVREAYRSSGVGLKLLQGLAEVALEHFCKRLDLNVLAWNDRAIQFYEKHGGGTSVNDEWYRIQFDQDALTALLQ